MTQVRKEITSAISQYVAKYITEAFIVLLPLEIIQVTLNHVALELTSDTSA